MTGSSDFHLSRAFDDHEQCLPSEHGAALISDHDNRTQDDFKSMTGTHTRYVCLESLFPGLSEDEALRLYLKQMSRQYLRDTFGITDSDEKANNEHSNRIALEMKEKTERLKLMLAKDRQQQPEPDSPLKRPQPIPASLAPASPSDSVNSDSSEDSFDIIV